MVARSACAAKKCGVLSAYRPRAASASASTERHAGGSASRSSPRNANGYPHREACGRDTAAAPQASSSCAARTRTPPGLRRARRAATANVSGAALRSARRSRHRFRAPIMSPREETRSPPCAIDFAWGACDWFAASRRWRMERNKPTACETSGCWRTGRGDRSLRLEMNRHPAAGAGWISLVWSGTNFEGSS